ncbi:UDP-N-acetylmuramyl pentapeptide phosphotransferase/UDP-N-acetylglucosamine-1-phosphate transferase [Cupriavidus gilardii J11]|uniref:UDP-N-acetylmuramyl pentapeptide phosphotransferase/UDP-N-acetylglucosamine-1-phosphate transferase n=1 Tax=Cupriavidus gilardii J11 TaxID=936133 RepID=A0A562BNC0_9BURK|nr:glycosyltransferase family 4 protein [Cupriavidus gilardii]TWG86420.1 UDP-N-acetylmuramyl pentapeptide phosphotransferase/UDP-N-acetylglucosamine-1-phosphate transferase [Cupriavidus gilardii J11]
MNALSPLIAFLVTLAGLYFGLRSSFFQGVADMPNERSLHVKPIPRFGGIMLMAGVVLSSLPAAMPGPALLAPILGLVFISFLDDRFNLKARWRFLAHALAAGWLLFAVIPMPAAWLTVFAFLCLVWSTNLYNFMDGSDGLAGGMAMFGFGAYGVAAWLGNDPAFATFAFTIAAAAVAFLCFNFHPARVFMGDSGSIPLGLLAGALGILGVQRDLWPLWFPLLVFAPFGVDATVTLARRVLRGEKPWQAHREHYYQRLVRMGWGHRRTALAEYALMAALAATGLACLRASASMQAVLVAAWVAVFIVIGLVIDAAWRRHGLERA